MILNVWDMHVDKNIFEIGYRSLNIIMGIKKWVQTIPILESKKIVMCKDLKEV